MEKIIFGLSKPRTWKPFAWLIMVAYGIPFSHTYVKIYSDKYKRFLIYQASSTMVNFMNMETFNEEAEIIQEFEFNMSDMTKTAVMGYAIDNCGKPYGVMEIFGICYVRICYWLGITVTNPLGDGSKTLVCSELVSDILREFFSATLTKDPDDMTPRDVFDLLQSIKQNNTTGETT